jgi:hypothetical protein
MDRYKNIELRCPRLGGEVNFSYCEREGGNIPCIRIISCWNPYFPVEMYLKKKMTKDAWERFSCYIPKDKVTTLIELIETAKKRAGEKNNRG